MPIDQSSEPRPSTPTCRIVVLNAGEPSTLSPLIREIAVRGAAYEIVHDEVGVMHCLLRGRWDLVILAEPTSAHASRELIDALDQLQPPPRVAGWDRDRARLTPLTLASPGPADHALPDDDRPDPRSQAGPPASPDGPTAARSTMDDDWAADTLTTAELSVLLGEAEATHP
jgi:hypothetical protein